MILFTIGNSGYTIGDMMIVLLLQIIATAFIFGCLGVLGISIFDNHYTSKPAIIAVRTAICFCLICAAVVVFGFVFLALHFVWSF